MSKTSKTNRNDIQYIRQSEKTSKMLKVEKRVGERLEDWLWRTRWLEKRAVKWMAQTAGVSYGTIRNWLDLCDIKRRSMKEVWQGKDYRKHVSSRMRHGQREKWSDPYFRKYHSELRSQRLKKMWRDSDQRRRIIQSQKEAWKDPGLKQRQAERMSQQSQTWWEMPDYRAWQLRRLSEVRELRSTKARKNASVMNGEIISNK
jgi:hypothetical protein